MRQDGSDAGAHVAASPQRHLADPDARDVGDRVERAWREDADLDARLPGAGAGGLGGSGAAQEEGCGETAAEKLWEHDTSITITQDIAGSLAAWLSGR